jgi:hypothetical protein
MTNITQAGWLTVGPGFDAADWYDCDDGAETLSHSEPDEAIESALDQWLNPKCDVLATLREMVGETLTVHAFIRKAVPADEPDVDILLEQVLERIDEEHGNPDEGTTPTPGMVKAAEEFAAAIRLEYVSWACLPGPKATINVEAWVRANRPDWLAEEVSK